VTSAAADSKTGGITAVVGGQGTVPLTSQFNIITTCPVGGAVTLPAGSSGVHCIIRNSGANPLLIYPPSGAQINAQTLNASITLVANGSAYFEGDSTTQWFTVP
jgi:hypothetical protein